MMQLPARRAAQLGMRAGDGAHPPRPSGWSSRRLWAPVALLLGFATSAGARPPAPPPPPTWQGPAAVTITGVRPEDALLRARLAAPPGATALRLRVRALDAEQPLGQFDVPLDGLVRVRGLPAGTWAVEATAARGSQNSAWSNPLVVEVAALGDGVQTVLLGADPALPARAPCMVGGAPVLALPAGDHTLQCGDGVVRLQVVAATATWEAPASLPRDKATAVRIKLAGGPPPAVVDLEVGGRRWPLRVTAAGLEGEVLVPAGFDRATLRDPDRIDGPPIAEVVLPAAGGGK